MPLPTPGHGPQLGAVTLIGHVTETGEPLTVLAMETPVPVVPVQTELPKGVMERIHLERFRSDYLNATGDLPFDRVTAGSDPPDFVVDTDDGTEGIDCTVLAIEDRRRAYSLFAHLRARLLELADDTNLDHLRDSVVRVWFGPGNELPPKRSDINAVEALVETLRSAELNRERITGVSREISQEGFPQRFPEGGAAIFWTPDGQAGFQIVPVNSGELGGEFAEQTGFACELSMSTEVRESQVREEYRRLVEQHDQTGTDHLLITLGAPDRSGVRYPAEEQLLSLITEDVVTVDRTNHIRTVTLHAWGSGTIGQIGVGGRGA